MITIVAPESAPWLMPILEGAVELGPVTVIAPWAQLSALPPWMPQRLHRYVARRRLPALSLSVLRLPGFAAAELGMRAWTGSRAERLLAGRFARRALTDRLSAVCLPHQTRLVIAPSCGARRVFARARDQGAATVLIEDLPNLRRLHRDLDVACGRHPRSSFLRRYRAPARTLARQEAERVLAQRIVVRGAFAADLLRAAGIQDHKLAGFQVPVEAPKPVTVRLDPPRVLLAGLATGRSGVVEALSAVEQVPGARLLVRAHNAAHGWRRLSPARSRLPLPWLITVMIINALLWLGHAAAALATAIAFPLYLRPSELMRLAVRQLIPPIS